MDIRKRQEEYFNAIDKPWTEKAIDDATAFSIGLYNLLNRYRFEYSSLSSNVSRTEYNLRLELEREYNNHLMQDNYNYYLVDRSRDFADIVATNTTNAVNEVIANNNDFGDIVAAMQTMWAFSYYRAEAISRTEVLTKMNYLDFLKYMTNPSYTALQWAGRRDHRIRDTHFRASGQTVPKGTPFRIGTAKMRFPGDGSLGAGPEEIVNCRCTLIGLTS